MNPNVELANIQHKLYTQWNKIDDYKSLSHNKLTITEYYILTDCMRELYKSGATSTHVTAVADWFKRNGAMNERGVEGHCELDYLEGDMRDFRGEIKFPKCQIENDARVTIGRFD